MRPTLIMISCLATLIGDHVLAQDRVDLPSSMVEDSSVTLSEIRRHSDLVFDEFAGPQGGPISSNRFVSAALPPEILPGQPDRSMRQKVFSLIDADGDGRLTRAEWNRGIEKELGFVDENEDGRITLQELAKARENVGLADAVGMMF